VPNRSEANWAKEVGLPLDCDARECVLPMVRFTGHNYPKGLGVLGLVLLSLKRGHMLDSSPAYPFSVKHIIVIVLARGAGLLGTPPQCFDVLSCQLLKATSHIPLPDTRHT